LSVAEQSFQTLVLHQSHKFINHITGYLFHYIIPAFTLVQAETIYLKTFAIACILLQWQQKFIVVLTDAVAFINRRGVTIVVFVDDLDYMSV
jgi:hypothetical protein